MEKVIQELERVVGRELVERKDSVPLVDQEERDAPYPKGGTNGDSGNFGFR